MEGKALGQVESIIGGDETVHWWQRAMPPVLVEKGCYNAFISATDEPQSDHSPGYSACSWIIKKASQPNKEVYRKAKRSLSGRSDEQRGYVAATLGAIATVPAGAKIIVHTNCAHVIDGLNGRARHWKANDWKNSQKLRVQNAELWEKLLLLIDERGIDARGEKVTRETCPALSIAHALAVEALKSDDC